MKPELMTLLPEERGERVDFVKNELGLMAFCSCRKCHVFYKNSNRVDYRKLGFLALHLVVEGKLCPFCDEEVRWGRPNNGFYLGHDVADLEMIYRAMEDMGSSGSLVDFRDFKSSRLTGLKKRFVKEGLIFKVTTGTYKLSEKVVDVIRELFENEVEIKKVEERMRFRRPKALAAADTAAKEDNVTVILPIGGVV